MQVKNIKSLSMGCRLNALEAEKIKKMLSNILDSALIVNTCAVTAEAERQSGQTIRRLARENPNVPIFVTGCGATRNPDLFAKVPNTFVIHNRDKMNLNAYLDALRSAPCCYTNAEIKNLPHTDSELSKQFIQIQNGCNHKCAYCVTRLLRGPSVSFSYDDILQDAHNAVANGYYEIVLTGVDSASYVKDGILLAGLCEKLLKDVPEIQRLRLSSIDPASPEIFKIIDLMHRDNRMMPHLHLSMQSGSDKVLSLMGRRHNANTVRKIVTSAGPDITFSWDIICGFPGESDELFNETVALAQETKPIKIHAFPFSPRPGTPAFDMPNQVKRSVSKQRVKIISEIADKHRQDFMTHRVGKSAQILLEENNLARDEHDIPVLVMGDKITPRTICNVELTNISQNGFVGKVL